MEIIDTNFDPAIHGELWSLNKALADYSSPIFAKRGIALFSPLEVKFFRFPEFCGRHTKRYFVIEEDIPLLLSFLKARDSGVKFPKISGLRLNWPEFLFFYEISRKQKISPEACLRNFISQTVKADIRG